MLKRIMIMLMTGLTLTTAAVSCKGETSIKETKSEDVIIQEIKDNYDEDEVEIYIHRQNGEVINYYATYVKFVKRENYDWGYHNVYNTVADQYDTNGNFIESHEEEGLTTSTWEKCMSYFDSVKP